MDDNKEEQTILEVKNLKIHFTTELGTVKAINNVNLKINSGQSLGIVGESGCGKSVTTQSMLRLLPPAGEIISGEIIYTREDGTTQKNPWWGNFHDISGTYDCLQPGSYHV